MEGLRGHTSGYAVPTYVVDAPGGGGKIPIMPNYLISYSDHKVVLRNYEGYITTYEEPPSYVQHDKSSLRLLPRAAPGAGPGRHPRPAPGRRDVDRACQRSSRFMRAATRKRTGSSGPRSGCRTASASIEGTARAPLPQLEARDGRPNGDDAGVRPRRGAAAARG